MLDQVSNIIAILIPIGTVLWAIWKRIGGVLDKLDHAINRIDSQGDKIDRLEVHQHEINGGIVQHMKEDAAALAELKAAVAHVEGRLDERQPRRRATA